MQIEFNLIDLALVWCIFESFDSCPQFEEVVFIHESDLRQRVLIDRSDFTSDPAFLKNPIVDLMQVL